MRVAAVCVSSTRTRARERGGVRRLGAHARGGVAREKKREKPNASESPSRFSLLSFARSPARAILFSSSKPRAASIPAPSWASRCVTGCARACRWGVDRSWPGVGGGCDENWRRRRRAFNAPHVFETPPTSLPPTHPPLSSPSPSSWATTRPRAARTPSLKTTLAARSRWTRPCTSTSSWCGVACVAGAGQGRRRKKREREREAPPARNKKRHSCPLLFPQNNDTTQVVVGRSGDQQLTDEHGEVTR
jgi:hypothetical protein